MICLIGHQLMGIFIVQSFLCHQFYSKSYVHKSLCTVHVQLSER